MDGRWAESCAPLVERLREEIARDGPITFARFMARALYDPQDGYYTTRSDRASREGDFLSAPEQDALFGALLARQLVECWERSGRPGRFILREDGAGSGALAEAVLAALRASAPETFAALRYEAVEVDPGRAAAIARRLRAAGLGAALGPPADPTRSSLDPGIVLANELLDALPVHRLTMVDGVIRELLVGWADGWFVERPGPLSDDRLADLLEVEGVKLVEGQRTEVCPAALEWAAGLGRDLLHGYAFVIDYGHPALERHAPDRPGGLLRTYRQHRVSDDPFRAVGRQDLTAHVDWTAVEAAAAEAGLDILGRTRLAGFALGLEAGSLLTELGSRPDTSAGRYLAARAALRDLLDPSRLGAFEVLVLGRGVPGSPPLRGLGAALPSGFGRARAATRPS